MSGEILKTPKKKALSRPKTYKEFIKWIAIPEPLRELKKQGDFAREFGVGEDTLSAWKKRDDFWKAVEVEWRQWGKIKTSNVIARFYTKVIGKEATTADIKLWLQYFLDWSEKIEGRIEHAGGIEIIHTYPKAKGDEKN